MKKKIIKSLGKKTTAQAGQQDPKHFKTGDHSESRKK